MAVQGGAAQAQINFTRIHEAEADRIGMQLLERSDFDPRGMPHFFQKLQKNTRYFSQAPEFLRSHPLTTSRIADSQARAEAIPRKSRYEESPTFKLIRAKIVARSFRGPGRAVQHCRQELQRNVQMDSDGTLRYGVAIAHTKYCDYAAARGLLQELLKNESENATFLLAAADVEVRQGDYPAA